MKQYIKLLKNILKKGNNRKDRTGIGTKSIFGYKMVFKIKKYFPLITIKKCNFKSIVYELLWFLKGDTNIKFLKKNNVNIWNSWANKKGNLGPIYGKQWRKWTYKKKKIDQIKNIIKQLKYDKYSRRIIVSSWNVGDIPKMSLPPCHILFQFYISNKNKLHCQLYQRSCDVFIGLPFNIACYSLLTYMLAQQCNLKPYKFIWIGGDTHIYNNHIKQIKLIIKRKPKNLPKLKIINKPKSIFKYKFNNFKLIKYKHHPYVKGKIAI